LNLRILMFLGMS